MAATVTSDYAAWQTRIKEVNAHFSAGNVTEWVKPVATCTDSGVQYGPFVPEPKWVAPAPIVTTTVNVEHFGTMTVKEAQDLLIHLNRDLQDVTASIDAEAYNFGDLATIRQYETIRATLTNLVKIVSSAI